MTSRLRRLAPLALAAWFLFLMGLDRAGFLSVDEPRYAWIGRAMAESGDRITPRLYGEPWFEKPPLLFWMTAAAWKLGLRDELAARLPVALTAVAFLALFWWCLRREWGVEVAAAATGILATCGGWLLYSHVAVTDVPAAAAMGAAMLLAWRERPMLAGVALGLAVLAKALLPVGLALPALLWWFWGRWRALGVGAAVALAVAAPWFLAVTARHGRVWFDELIVRHHLARVFNAKSDILHPQPWWFYAPVLAVMLLPWIPLAFAAHPRRLWADRRTRFFAIWLGSGVLALSLSQGKLPGYLLPLLPAAAVLLGIALVEAPLARQRVVLAAAVILAAALYAAPEDELLAYIVKGPARLPVSAWGWAGLAIAGPIAWWWAGRRFSRALVAVILLMGGLRHWAAGIAERHTARPFAELAARACAEEGLHRAWRYGLAYYAHAPLPDCRDEAREWRARSPESVLFLSEAAATETVAPKK